MNDLTQNNQNKLYTYTSMTEMIASFASTPGWLRVKQGLTLKQEIEDRIKQQDNASTTSDLVLLSTLVIQNNDVKLDDKVRIEQHKNPEFMHFERFDNAKKKHEWSLVKINDLVPNWDELLNEFRKVQLKETLDIHIIENFLAKNFLYNRLFLTALDKRIFDSKQNAVEKITGKLSYKDIILRPWQKETTDEMLNADKVYNLLSLAPRFGKTYTILEYMKQFAKTHENKIILVPASKNLSSNASFINDYYEGGYNVHGNFNIIGNASLFQDEDALIDKLKEIIKDQDIIMVTDEADIASHTSISQTKMERIKTEFNVIRQIAMSGTGIYKAAKIFSGISEDDIFFKTMNYTELSGFETKELVKRHFWNVQYSMDDLVQNLTSELEAKNISEKRIARAIEVFNVNQAFQQSSAYRTLAKYVRKFVDDDIMNDMLQKSDVIMVFTPSRTKRQLQNFVKVFSSENEDIATLILTGDETTNGEAEEKTKDKLSTMKKLNDTRKLVIFSMAMASRSFSIPEIRRVIIFGDGFITAPWYQKAARCLTYNMTERYTQPIQEADIIRVSFQVHDLAAELFLVENPVIDRTDVTLEKMKKQLERNSFANITFDELGDMSIGTILTSADAANDALESALKYTDSTKYIMTQLVEEELSINEELSKMNPHSGHCTTSVSISVPSRKKKGENIAVTPGSKLTAKDEKALEVYIDIVRLLPYVAEALGKHTLDGLLELDWEGTIIIDKLQFIENLKNKRFSSVVNTMFRNIDTKNDVITEKFVQYTMFDY